LEKLFPNGLTFVLLPYLSEWSESQQRLRRIDAQNLAKALATATGHEGFLEAIRTAHTGYGKVLGITEANGEPEAPSLAQGLYDVRAAIVLYVVQVIAWAQLDEGRFLEAGFRALKPIDVVRAACARSSERKSDDEETEVPQASPESASPADASEATTETPDPETSEEGPVSTVG
jgi:hypothetical protein